MAVVAALELDDHVAPGKAARQADRAHRGFGAGGHQAHHVHARHALDQQFGQFDLAFRRRAESKPPGRCFLHRAHGIRIGMTEDQRPPGTDVIEIVLAVGIPYAGTGAGSKEARRAADGAEGADGRIDAAGNGLLGAEKELFVTGHGRRAGNWG